VLLTRPRRRHVIEHGRELIDPRDPDGAAEVGLTDRHDVNAAVPDDEDLNNGGRPVGLGHEPPPHRRDAAHERLA
jgi:hypothetical protein